MSSDFPIILFTLGLCFGILMLKITLDFIKPKGKWLGINVSRTNCPKCGQRTPYIRTPTSTRQALWEGWTCSGCGIEIEAIQDSRFQIGNGRRRIIGWISRKFYLRKVC